MAVTKAKRRHNRKQQTTTDFEDFPVYRKAKFPIYQSLLNVNQAFQTIAYEIERLDDYEAVPLQTLSLYMHSAQELRSAINHRVMGVLTAREERDWYRYGAERRRQEAILERS